MRASVMLHLPGLTIMKRMNRIAQTIVLVLQLEVFMEKDLKFMAIYTKFQTNLL